MLGKQGFDTNYRILAIDEKNVSYFKELKSGNNNYNDFAKKYKDYWDRLFLSSKSISMSQQDEHQKKKYDDLCLAFQAIKLELLNDEKYYKNSIPTDQCEVYKISEEDVKKGFIVPVKVNN